MNNNSDQAVALVIGPVLAIVLVAAVLASGVLPYAILLGALASGAAGLISRKAEPALWAGGVTSILIMLVGAFNVLVPGWHNNLV